MTKRGMTGRLTDREKEMLDTIKEQRLSLREKKEFSEYQYEGEFPVTPWGMLGKYWETIAHAASNSPLEYLTPISPASKLIHMRTAIESYRGDVVYGTQNSFWQHPIAHFLSPFSTMSAAAAGWEGVPGAVQETRDIEEYFDALKYIKYTRLKKIAEDNRDYSAAGHFDSLRQETLVGVNPLSHNYSHIFRALPRRDRDYFNAFVDEDDPVKRAEILNLVPANEKGLLVARWKLAKAEEIKKEQKAGRSTSEGEAFLSSLYSESRAGGVPMSKALNSEYLSTREGRESYADWYRRVKVLPAILKNRNIPGPDYVGWHPGTDLDSIKLKLVQDLGRDMHDFDLWPSDAATLARRPFINDEAVREVSPDTSMSDSEIRARLRQLLQSNNMEDVDISVAMYPSDRTSYNVDLDIVHDRSEEIAATWKRGI